VTINIRDIANEKVDLKEDAIEFSGVSDKQPYSATVNLFKEVKPEVLYLCYLYSVQESKWSKLGLNLQIMLMKKDIT